MRYVGMQTQISRNNRLTILLLLMFPVILLGMIWCFLVTVCYFSSGSYDDEDNYVNTFSLHDVNQMFIGIVPWVVAVVGIWFVVAYFSNVSMVRKATGARPLTRKENPRIYNIVENLCMTCNMDMPKINIVDEPELNAFASGIDKKSYTVTLTKGIIDRLDDDELSGVVGHELTHIRNHDTRLLIISIIFVGIISTLLGMAVQMMWTALAGGGGRGRGNGAFRLVMFLVFLLAVVCCAVAYFMTSLTRFAISRKREYMADAGGAELCGNPLALASALRKISDDPGLDEVDREDIAQLFIIRPCLVTSRIARFYNSLFSTHPDTKKRIKLLEQF